MHVVTLGLRLLIQGIERGIVGNDLEPGKETAAAGVEASYLPESLFEASGTDVIHKEGVEIAESGAQVSLEGIHIGVPQLGKGGTVTYYRPSHQFINGLQASSFHNYILPLKEHSAAPHLPFPP